MASLSDSEKVSILRLTVLFAVDFNVHTSSETPLTESASGWGCFLPCSENHLMSLLKDDWCIGDYQHGLLCVLSYYKDIVLRYSISPSPGSDVITQAQLVSACTHFVFVCAISLGACDFEKEKQSLDLSLTLTYKLKLTAMMRIVSGLPTYPENSLQSILNPIEILNIRLCGFGLKMKCLLCLKVIYDRNRCNSHSYCIW